MTSGMRSYMTQPLFLSEVERTRHPSGLTLVSRRAFARDFPYKPGEHNVFGGPSTKGKTTLAFDLMEYVCTPECPGYVAQSKPDDKVTRERGQQLGFRTVSEWPPTPKLNEVKAFGGQKPPGYIVVPPFGNLADDMDRCAELTERLLMERYSAGADPRRRRPGVLVMDDTMVKAKILHQDHNMVTILAMGAAMGLGMWIFVQRPAGSGNTALWGYENATHIFLAKGGDAQMRKRYSEILGEYGPIAIPVLNQLEAYQFLYYHTSEGYLCIVDAK